MNSRKTATILCFAGLCIVVTYNACLPQSGSIRRETIYGNPVTANLEISFSPFTATGAKNYIQVCLKHVEIYSTDPEVPPISASVNSESVVLGTGGNVFLYLHAPSGSYNKTRITLSGQCLKRFSIEFENAQGLFSLSDDIDVYFSGELNSDSKLTRVDLNIQSLMNSLASVSSSNEMNTIVSTYSGTWTTAKSGWRPMSNESAPSARSNHTTLWTGTEVFIWGGSNDSTGGRYDPVRDSWQPVSTVNSPEKRNHHVVVWTGKEVIVWGGVNNETGYLRNGGRYDPATDTWKSISEVDAPPAASNSSAVWTGKYMIVWGGLVSSNYVKTDLGGRYDPETDSWTPVSISGGPGPRAYHIAFWTGRQMVVWGGEGDSGEFHNGAKRASGKKYDPETDTWTSMAPGIAKPNIGGACSTWTGSKLIVWGGVNTNGPIVEGSIYDNETDEWKSISTVKAPDPREKPMATWSGKSMLVWGGYSAPDRSVNLISGAQYFPENDTWVTFDQTNTIEGRIKTTPVWTGTEMIVWGGRESLGDFSTGGRYTPVDYVNHQN